MNLSGYFVLAAAIVSIVFGQQSDLEHEIISVIQKSSKKNLDANVFPNATLTLENRYINATKILFKSEEKIKNEFEKARKLLVENPEATRQLLQQTFTDARDKLLVNYAIPILVSLGEAFGLSNDVSTQGLIIARKSLETGGFAVLNALNAAESLLIGGLNAGGEADEVLLKAGQLAVENGYAGGFYSIRKSIKEADQALRDAKSNPNQGQDEKQNCTSVEKDPAGSKAQMIINEAAQDALKRGANAELVQRLKNVLSCSLGDLVKIADDEVLNDQKLKQFEGLQPLDAKIKFSRWAEALKTKLSSAVSRIYLIVGDVAVKSGNQSNNKIGAAIAAITTGQGNLSSASVAMADSIALGQRGGEDASKLGIQAAFKIGTYAKIAFIQSISRCAQIAFSVL